MSFIGHPHNPQVGGSILLKLRLGDAPQAIASGFDVRAGHAQGARRMGVRAVDRVLGRSVDDLRITRVHTAARSAGRPGRGHTGFDETEHALGLSRTFRIDTDRSTDPERLLDDLRSINEVESASPNYLSSTPFAVVAPAEQLDATRDRVNATEAAGYEPGDPSVTVAVLDTGISTAPSAGGRHLRRGFDSVQLAAGQLAPGLRLLGDNIGIDTDPLDEVGHGTACASIIAGQGNGVPPGVAAGCSLLPVRVLGSVQIGRSERRVGIGSIHDIDVGFKRAVDLGAKVLNLSFGTSIDDIGPLDPIPHEDVVAYALARGCVLVAASGNSGRRQRYAPAALDGVITVGATDHDDAPASFSTSGDHVDLCAPGERVLAAGLDRPVFVTGTSFAAPFVSAAASLLVSRAARRAEPLDAFRTRDVLLRSVRRWPAGQGVGHGAGHLDVLASLRTLDADLDRGPPGDRASPTPSPPANTDTD